MKAILPTDAGLLGSADVREPRAEAGEIVLDVACAIVLAEDLPFRPSPISGHRLCARDPATGGRYAVWPGTACGRCEFCRMGRENLCLGLRTFGVHRDGGLAERLAVPIASLVPVLDSLPTRLAALAEPAGRGLNALRRAGIVPGERVLILGSGPVGLLAAWAAKEIGAAPFVSGPDHPFLAAAGIAAGREAPAGPFEVAVDTVLSVETAATALASLAPGGRLSLPGPAPLGMGLAGLEEREIAIVGAGGCTRDQVAAGLHLLARGREAADLLIDYEVTLADLPALLGAPGPVPGVIAVTNE